MYQFTNNQESAKGSATMPSYKTIRGAKVAASKFYSSKTIYLAVICLGCVVAERIDGAWIDKDD